MKKIIFLISLLLFGQAIFANSNYPWNSFQSKICDRKLNEFINQNQISNLNFREVLADTFSERAFRVNSLSIGQVFEIHFQNEKLSKIVKVLNEKMEIAEVNQQSCEFNFVEKKFPWYVQKAFEEKRENEFLDNDLRELVLAQNSGIIYFWSPKFSYSVEYLPEILKISKKLNLKLTVVADPRASKTEINQSINKVFNLKTNQMIRAIASEDKIKIMKSYDLFLRNGFNHFPVMYYYHNKKVHPHWITGLMTLGGMKEMTKSFAKDLK